MLDSRHFRPALLVVLLAQLVQLEVDQPGRTHWARRRCQTVAAARGSQLDCPKVVEEPPERQVQMRGCSLRTALTGLDGTAEASHCQLVPVVVEAVFRRPIQSTNFGCSRWRMTRKSWAKSRCRQAMGMPFSGRICAEARPTPFRMSDKVWVLFFRFLSFTYNSQLCFLLQQVAQLANGFDAFKHICRHFIHCWGAILL